MTPNKEVPHLSGIDPARINFSQTAHLDVSCPRSVGNESGLLCNITEDQATFRRWKTGFLVFYGAIISLLAGLAVAVDRPETSVSAAMHDNPAKASTNLQPRLAQGR
jgi:hypothetical protein